MDILQLLTVTFLLRLLHRAHTGRLRKKATRTIGNLLIISNMTLDLIFLAEHSLSLQQIVGP